MITRVDVDVTNVLSTASSFNTIYSAYSVKNAVQDLSGWGVSRWKEEGKKKG